MKLNKLSHDYGCAWQEEVIFHIGPLSRFITPTTFLKVDGATMQDLASSRKQWRRVLHMRPIPVFVVTSVVKICSRAKSLARSSARQGLFNSLICERWISVHLNIIFSYALLFYYIVQR